MSVAAESLEFEKDTPSRSAQAGAPQTAPTSHVFDPFVQRIFGNAPSDPADSVRSSLSMQRFSAPVLQRAQRLYGNRASRQIVMRAQTVQRQCACGGTCAKCQQEEQQRQVQRSSAAPAPYEFEGLPRSTGEQLDPSMRAPMEGHFGADLSGVRVHTGSEAAQSATSIDALAYTSGRDIYFASGMYAPSSGSGRRLLAHEVAHVVQQGSGKEPSIATKSAHGAKISAPDDPLEAEADRAADEFMSAPLTDEDERKKREAGAPVHRVIQRQEVPTNTPTPAPATPQQLGPVFGPQLPPAPDAEVLEVDSWTFSTDARQLRDELFKVVGERGINGPYKALSTAAMKADSIPGAGSYSEHPVIKAMEDMIPGIVKECEGVIDDFERKIKANVDKILAQNKTETQQEIAKYGISMTEHEDKGSCETDEFGRHCTPSYKHTEYGMQTQSVESLGLSDAAKILLDRANLINAKKNEQATHVETYCDMDACFTTPDDKYDSYTPIIQQMEKEYARVRGPLEEKYPVLAPFADNKDSPEGLATLANKDASRADEKTRLVGEKLKDTLTKIEDVQQARRDNDLNVWRLDKVVDVTKLQNGTKDDPVRNKLIEEKFEKEKPSKAAQILLLAINILGLVLAAPTGGISLVLTAGINAAVAVKDVREYLLKNSLAGSGLGAAKALSQDVPSLFWLAVEIVGVGVDVGAAAGALTKTFSTLAKLATAAEEAKGTEEAADTIKALKEAASHEPNGEALVAGIERHFEAAGKEGGALEAFGGTKAESELFEASTKAAKQAGEEAEKAVVPSAATIAGGEVKATSRGLMSCHSPCMFLRDRFTAELALREDLNKKLLDLEAEVIAKQGDQVALQSIAERARDVENELRQTLTFNPARLGEPGFDELLKRRGSGAENLVGKPKDWVGADEASFKFGDKAVLDAEQAEKYYWRLDQDGKLSLVRKDTEFPKLRFDETKKEFAEVEEAGVVRARTEEGVVPKGTDEGRFAKSRLKTGEQKEFDAIMKERKTLIEERNTLQELDETGKLTAEQEERLSKVRGLINQQSEQLGNKAAQRYMESLGAKPVFTGAPGQSGVFDQVWTITEKLPDGTTVEHFFVVEAKGGSAGLGTRIAEGGVAAEQGTPQYFESILANMGTGQLKTDLRLAYDAKRVTYLRVQAPIGTKAGEAVLSDFKVGQFALYPK